MGREVVVGVDVVCVNDLNSCCQNALEYFESKKGEGGMLDYVG